MPKYTFELRGPIRKCKCCPCCKDWGYSDVYEPPYKYCNLLQKEVGRGEDLPAECPLSFAG